MKISILIPTFKRVEYLKKALRGLSSQRRRPDQIVIGLRTGDEETVNFLKNRTADGLPIETIEVSVPGVIASMNAAAARTTGEVVCLLDDDAEPLPDWLEKIESRFGSDQRIGILGGRDLLQDHPEMRKAEPTTDQVGIFTWYGRLLGNHHKAHGELRKVDLVKGCNASVRGEFLRRRGLDTRLRGKGAQVHWELALCLDAANEGLLVAYDPAIQVIHHIAPRHDNDLTHRGGFSPEGLYDMSFNEQFVISTRASAKRRLAHLAWSVFVGSLSAPGLLQYLRLILKRDPNSLEKLRMTQRAMSDARKFAATQS